MGRLCVLSFGSLQQLNAMERCNLRDVEFSRPTSDRHRRTCNDRTAKSSSVVIVLVGISWQETALQNTRFLLPRIALNILLAFATPDRNQCQSYLHNGPSTWNAYAIIPCLCKHHV